jgi:hypothetical protein
MEVSTEEIINAFVQALGREAAEKLINRKIGEASLPYKERYDVREFEKLMGELKKENVLIRTLALLLLSQIRLRRMLEET